MPSPTDLIPVSQAGTCTAVTFSSFLGGLSAVPGIDGSALKVTPTGAGTRVSLGDLAAGALSKAGGVMTGALTLSADPAQPAQAATKNYVDARVRRAGDVMTGPLALAADPMTSLQAATKNYVDARVLKAGDTMTGALAVPQLTINNTVGTGAASALLSFDGASLQSSQPIQVLAFAPSSGANVPLIQAGQEGSTPGDVAVMSLDYTVTHTGGTLGSVNSGLRLNGRVWSTPTSAIWAQTILFDSQAGSPNGFDNGILGYNSTMTRSLVPGSTYLYAAQTATSGTVLTFASTSGVQVGQTVGGSGIAAGTAVTAVTPTSVTISKSITATVPSGNRIDFYNSALPTSAPTSSGNVLQFTNTAGVTVGQQVSGAGIGSATFVKAVSPTTVTLSQPVTGTVPSGTPINIFWVGSAIWGANFSVIEGTNQPSSVTGGVAVLELDYSGNGADDSQIVGISGQRQMFPINISKRISTGANLGIGTVMGVYSATDGSVTVNNVHLIRTQFNTAVLNPVGAVQSSGANAIWLADGHRIALSSDGSKRINWDPSAGQFALSSGRSEVFTVDAVGNGSSAGRFTAAGPVTASGFLAASGTFTRAILDATSASQAPGANAVWLGDGQTIALSSDGTKRLYWDSNVNELVFNVAGAAAAQVDASGNANLSGVLRASGLQVSGAITGSNSLSLGGAVTAHGFIASSGTFATAVINTTAALQGSAANAIWLGDGHTIALSADGSKRLGWDPNLKQFAVSAGTTALFSVNASGSAAVTGSLQAAGLQISGPVTAAGSLTAGAAVTAPKFAASSGTFTGALFSSTSATQAPGANAIWIGDAQSIAFTTDGTRKIYWDPNVAQFIWNVAGAAVMSVDGAGHLYSAGSVLSSSLQINGPINGTGSATVGGAVTAASFTAAPGSFSGGLFDARKATEPSAARTVWLADGQSIALDTLGNHVLNFNPATKRLVYKVGGAAIFSVDEQGNIRASGSVTPNTTP